MFTTPFQAAEFEQYITKEAAILDVGCGYGRTLNELYQSGYHNLTGIDFSKEMIARSRKQFPHLDLRIKENAKIDLPAQSADAVILFAVLTCIHQNTAQQELITEILRVLKPGGIYSVFELPEGAICRHHSKSWLKELLSPFKTQKYEPLTFTTMNGNTSNGFYYIGQKPI